MSSIHKPQVFIFRNLIWLVIFIFAAQAILFTESSTANMQAGASTCPGIVTTALDATTNSCGGTSRNQLCYGHNLVRLEPQPFVSDFTFQTPGDTIPVARVRSVRGSALDIDNATWGVALLKVQADLPNLLPNQNLTFLLFGDAQITNGATRDMVTLPMTTNSPTNMRTGPSLNAPVLASLAEGQTVLATGRLEDNSWLRVWIPQQEGKLGWAFASLLSISEGDLNTLNVIDPRAGSPALGSLDAFYLTTSNDEVLCNEIPGSGLLIQTPEGAGTIRLYINEVKVDIGSTVFIQAHPGSGMTIGTLEGMARVEADEHVEVAAAGSQVTVPLDENSSPAGPPEMPVPYDQAQAQALPVAILERHIDPAPALDEESIAEIHDLVQNDAPLCGVGSLRPCSTIVVEGTIRAMNDETISVNGMRIVVSAGDSIRSQLEIGTRVHVEGNLDETQSRVIPTKIVVLPPTPLPPTPTPVPTAAPVWNSSPGDNNSGGDSSSGGDSGAPSTDGSSNPGVPPAPPAPPAPTPDSGDGDGGMGMGMGWGWWWWN